MLQTKLRLLLYQALLIVSVLFAAYYYQKSHYVFFAIGIAIIIFSCITILLVPERINKKIAYFLNAVKNNDTTLSYPINGTSGEKELHAALNRLNSILKENKMASEEREIYFHTILNQAATGLLIRENDTKISMANQAILKLCGLPVLYHINQLDRVSEKFKQIIQDIEPEKEVLENISLNNERLQLSFQATKLTLRNKEVVLISVRNLHKELDRNEVESWIKLIRVLTHEIMNSLAPITSVTQTLVQMLEKEELDESIVAMVKRGLSLVNEQSEGLTNFVNSYRSLTRVPEPDFKLISVDDLFMQWENYGRELASFPIAWEREEVARDLQINTDPQMLTRVSSNLIKNAVEAISDEQNPTIRLKMSGDNKIVIANNGPEIEEVVLENIFVPFFTTKESGSGIGLSLCKQIAKKLNLQLSVRTSVEETSFEIKW